jgi:hypothetical protein
MYQNQTQIERDISDLGFENLANAIVMQAVKDYRAALFTLKNIEDDCRSIGGKWQMTITYVQKEIKSKIKSIVVKEFEGIEQLPNNLKEFYFGVVTHPGRGT